MNIDPVFIVELIKRWPWLWVLAAGSVFGLGLTQLIKQSWLTFGNVAAVSRERYKLGVRWLAALTTYLFSLGIWHSVLDHGALEEWICAGWALVQPLLYDAIRALVATRWPDFAAKWGNHASPE
jgi:hypothetical protein